MRLEFRFTVNSLLFLLAVNTVMFFLVLFISSIYGLDGDIFRLIGGMTVTDVYAGNFYQLITSVFLHIQPLHFLLNIYSLFVVGKIVDFFYGGKKLFIVFIFGGIVASLTTYVGGLFTGVDIMSLGASGAIFALVGLLIGGVFKKNRFGFDLPFSISDILPYVLISLALGFIPGSNINNWAHFGGLITGIVFGLLIQSSSNEYYTKSEKSVVNVLGVVSKIAFGLSYLTLFLIFVELIFFK